MEMGSDGEDQIPIHHTNNNNKIDNPNDVHAKPKRQMKTPFQLETLERIYSEEMYPSEATRADLSEKLDLTDRQLQMWFCHRRLKDKKDSQSKKPPKAQPLAAKSPAAKSVRGSDSRSGSGSGGSGCSPYSEPRRNFVSGGSTSSSSSEDKYEAIGKASYEPQLSAMVHRAILCIEAQLGESLRDDGPVLGMDFDLLPPGAFGTPIAMQKHQVDHYESKLYEPHDARPRRPQASGRYMDDPSSFTPEMYGRYSENHARGGTMDYDIPRSKSSSVMHENGPLPRSYGNASRQDMPSLVGDSFLMERDLSVPKTEDQYMLSDGMHKSNDVIKKGKVAPSQLNDVTIGRGSETRENIGPKDVEKLEIQRKRIEERVKKEMERHERERRKEEERLMRERVKEEERIQREQKRENERREKFLQREHERAEKKKQLDEIRREKDAIRRKIAVEKATARRIAKESMDLIEDEQLELMEIAATSKGLPSVLQLDHDTLQNLEQYRDSLSTFPPKALQLKMPFNISPWKDSEDNVGNLLMVWRFLISFSDILDLWPFTLDEFIQAFHDYDSKLLEEIHVTLLRLIIRDIEDVARTPYSGIGNNQYTTANPEGGHPQIVEGAYAWGFDIRSWKQHLSPLTWPEILRQLALSTGLGPKLKRTTAQLSRIGDKDDAKGCKDIISNIRSGSAAETAFAQMREKGLLAPRKSRHRLTPGTVKFAAFHVLSLEGSKGLTVLELADKIQKSGLRDLTTSKTPEASISVALTRDVKLFERIAPSTYCVRAPYVKEPTNGEAILEDARKKIKAFENGLVGPEDVSDLLLERDEDFECDIDEDPEVDEPNGSSSPPPPPGFTKKIANSEQVKDIVVEEHKNTTVVEISNQGQSWIRGLTEGDYCHLTVEERLEALVALVGIANEGNSIRAGLEERMEAANTLKKQMCAEAQLDNSTMRDKPMDVISSQAIVNQEANETQHGYASKRSRSQLKSYISQKAEEVYPYRSLPLGQDRRHNRYWLFAATACRSDPCTGLLFVELHGGKWRLIDTEEAFDFLVASLDMRGIRESHLRIMLQKIEGSFKDNACKSVSNSDAMETSTSIRVELGGNDIEKKNISKRFYDFQRWMWREAYGSLPYCARKYGKKRCEVLSTCEVCVASYLSEYTHCTSCHQRLGMVDDSTERKIVADSSLIASPLPFGVRLLKALLVYLEASVPDGALESFWTEEKRKMWGVKLNASSSPEELLQVLISLESAIKKESLSSNFVSVKELLNDASPVDVLPWLPKTVSVVAMRLSDLDAAIIYVKPEEPEPEPILENEIEPIGSSILKGKGPKEQEEQYEAVPNSVKKRNKRGKLSFGSGSNKKAKRKKAQGGPSRFVVVKRDVVADRKLMSVELNQQQVPGRGKRTVRKRPERNDEDNYRLVKRVADIVRPKSEQVEEEEDEEEEMDEEWANVTSNQMAPPMQVDDESEAESEDDGDGQFVGYSQRNKWGLDWNSNNNQEEVMEDDEEKVVGFKGVEREMSESSEDDVRLGNNYDREVEDYSSSSGSDS